MYTAVVLTPESQTKLIAHFKDVIPANWEIICHHMTVNMGDLASGPAASHYQLGETFGIEVNTIGHDDRVIAVGVACMVPSVNNVKHITLAVNRAAGGKPFHSNNLTKWEQTSPLKLDGVLTEVN